MELVDYERAGASPLCILGLDKGPLPRVHAAVSCATTERTLVK